MSFRTLAYLDFMTLTQLMLNILVAINTLKENQITLNVSFNKVSPSLLFYF